MANSRNPIARCPWPKSWGIRRRTVEEGHLLFCSKRCWWPSFDFHIFQRGRYTTNQIQPVIDDAKIWDDWFHVLPPQGAQHSRGISNVIPTWWHLCHPVSRSMCFPRAVTWDNQLHFFRCHSIEGRHFPWRSVKANGIVSKWFKTHVRVNYNDLTVTETWNHG